MKNHIHCLVGDRFGAAVVDRLRALELDVSVQPIDVPVTEAVSDAALVALVASRSHAVAAEALDEWSFRTRIAWTQIRVAESSLISGPLVVPGASGCSRCAQRRARTHAPTAERDKAIDAYFALHPDLEVPGYLPAIATLAAGLLAEAAAAPRRHAGRQNRIDILGGDWSLSELVPMHDCPRCGGGDQVRPGARSFDALLPALTEVMS